MEMSYPTYSDLELEIQNLEQENRRLSEKNKIYSNALIQEKEEKRKLKEDNRFLTKICKEYMEKENIIEISEFTELYRDDLEKENKKLKERIEELERIVKELVEYKQDITTQKAELIDGKITPVGYYTHEYKAQFLDKEQDDE